jgi:hypothetical protein
MGDTPEFEEILTGGGLTEVSKVGATVRRSKSPWSASVSELLPLIRANGFEGVPKFLGFDDAGREVLEFIVGEVGNYPLSLAVRSTEAIESASRLLRDFHQATEPFLEQARGMNFQFPAMQNADVILHGDFAPYNCVFRGTVAVGIIDFDCMRIGPKSWDLAYALYRFAPLTTHDNSDGFGELDEKLARARAFLDTYGASDALRRQVLDQLVPRLRFLIDNMHPDHIRQGHDELYRGDIRFVEEHFRRLSDALFENRFLKD